ncbi:rRNA (cytidine-2'-O-)-methyltransferase [Rhodanobacter sp. FW510-R12]|uniref:16S rRNA (cytidine(1402)-2'-O)-methyltransferase n=1 Tax=unclassified Rhodanobacter TaxID=2621553 RepID=UPI0007A9B34D|nr:MULTISPECIES: 16S rRNA (cytidine(1402)-2'-O)-methyltransferase [unclassified Rhodanobacter]KZC17235.1 rRNA (cytidine-2'-O-)-methyltransferase [Rhodanobacter sp. FW104-R8]KZC29091.1 rRNA (cytidine-2'-O-)-methyltransferase [Rhodanobacter sp. FW510-T8]KZC33029.1 rRNA (cytidine-2'-O-)-methyltransferase [Rhodanobacter sp. FW510-R10]
MSSGSVQPGSLWVVATPIGHRDDLSARAIETLRAVAVIAAEDTRHSRPLLVHHNIDTPLVALHEHNERDAVEAIVRRMQGGNAVALISDAGTPLISDPGFRLVRAARAAGIRCIPVPGACAAIAALSVAGLPSDRFVFEGFLPPKAAARRSRLQELAGDARTVIFYESSHRVAESLADMRDVFGADREAVLARELTKLFETVLGEPLGLLAARVAADPDQQRGECVVLVAGRGEEADAKLAEGRRVFAILREELPPAKAAKLAAAISGAPRKDLYRSE